MNRKRLLLVLLAALVLFYFVYVEEIFNYVSFDEGIKKINETDKKFELKEKIVPSSEEKLKQYQIELVDLEKEFSEKKQNEDLKALNYLIDIRKELVLMQLNLIELEKERNCSEQIELIDSVKSSAVSARDSIQNYIANYTAFAEKTKEWNENVLDTTSSIILSFRELKEETQAKCPE
jgi:hypothetical protein